MPVDSFVDNGVNVAFKMRGQFKKQFVSKGERTKLSFMRNGSFEQIAFFQGMEGYPIKGRWVFNSDQTKIGFRVTGPNFAKTADSRNIATNIDIIKLTTDSLILRRATYYSEGNDKPYKVSYIYDEYYVNER